VSPGKNLRRLPPQPTRYNRKMSRPDWHEQNQNWEEVKIVNRSVTAAKRAGAHVPVSAEVATARRLDSDAPLKKKYLTNESRQAIIQLRVANKWSQADLNTQCAFPPNTIRDIEAGRATPTGQQLTILNRVLKTTLKFA
jgi:ribosome-binding protein aMBF1 (putative translation factor)